jgi:predicted AlkP superfamily pyrophosphatase or phosphodiesterase
MHRMYKIMSCCSRINNMNESAFAQIRCIESECMFAEIQNTHEVHKNKTILILLDGCGLHAATENLGYLEQLAENNLCVKYRLKCELPSSSRPLYETLFTGLPMNRHGIVNNLTVRMSKHRNLFSLCREKGLVTAAAAYSWVSELYKKEPFDVTQDRICLDGLGNIQYGLYYYEDEYPDSHVFSDAEFLRKSYNPDFLLVHTMNIDDAGHKAGSNSAEYNKSVAKLNTILSTYVQQWLELGYQIVVTADHGMDAWGLHGGNTESQRAVPLYIMSDKVPIKDFPRLKLNQLVIAPLLCRLLGIDPTEDMAVLSQWEGLLFD